MLYDDSAFSADIIQSIVHRLCFNNSRATKAVSIPTPVHYAHLAALRGRHYVMKLMNMSDDDDTLSISSSVSNTEEQAATLNLMNQKIQVTEQLKSRLYYV